MQSAHIPTQSLLSLYLFFFFVGEIIAVFEHGRVSFVVMRAKARVCVCCAKASVCVCCAKAIVCVVQKPVSGKKYSYVWVSSTTNRKKMGM